MILYKVIRRSFAPPLMIVIIKLLSNRCVYGTSICTCSAIEACISVDNVDAVALGDSLNGALGSASAASDACISNLVSHG